MHALQRAGQSSTRAAAIRALGPIIKTLYVPTYLDDDTIAGASYAS